MPAESSLDRWEMLRRGGQVSSALEIPSVDTGIETGFGTVRLALGHRGELRLLLPVRQSERIAEIPSSPSLAIGVATYALSGTPIRFLDITCMTDALDGVFADVASEIMRRIMSGASPVEAGRTTLEDFRSLLVNPPIDVSIKEIRGLIGELLMLRRMLVLDPRAWQLWRGPLMERHDFRGGIRALEIKTAGRAATRTVTISAVDQLLPPSGGTLHLALYHLEETAGGDISVASLASEAARLASDRQELGLLLAAAGCPDPEAPGWNRSSFRLEDEHHYRVDESFPRIVPQIFPAGALPAGIASLSYVIDLAMAQANLLDEGTAAEHVEEMVTCIGRP